jgi:hypothetical protein
MPDKVHNVLVVPLPLLLVLLPQVVHELVRPLPPVISGLLHEQQGAQRGDDRVGVARFVGGLQAKRLGPVRAATFKVSKCQLFGSDL